MEVEKPLSISTIETSVKNDYIWLKSHIVLIVLFSVIAFGAVYGVESLIASRTAANDSKWQLILAAQTQQTKLLQSQLSIDEAKWEQINSQLLAANDKLAASISNRNVQLAAQSKVDQNLNSVEAAKKLGGTANGDSVVLPLPASRQIIVSLDELESLKLDLTDTKKSFENEVEIAQNLQSNIDSEKKLVDGLKAEMATQTEACKAQVSDLKAQARKSKLKWFFWGVVTGVVSGRLLGI